MSEAIRLCRILMGLLPHSAEAHGLLGLMLLHYLRHEPRLNAAREFVHAEAPRPEGMDWQQVATLYNSLATMTRSMVVEFNLAAAEAT